MKGMRKIKRGSGARGKLEYSFDNKKGDFGVIVGGNMTGTNPRELAKEFSASRKLREDVKKPVWHNSLRLPEGETLSPERWNEIGNEYMKRMGFSTLHQRVFILHDDPKGQHIHIDACRISLSGELYLGANENLKSTQIIHQLEKEFGLSVHSVEQNPFKTQRKAPTPGGLGMSERMGALPIEMRMQAIIDDAVSDKPSFEVMVTRLEDAGMSVMPTGATGQPQGVSFALDGEARTGSKLGGKSYAWMGIKSRIDYDPVRDQHIIDQLRIKRDRAAEEEKGEITPTLSAAPPTGKGNGRRTIDRAFEVESTDSGSTVYRWSTNHAVALIDHGDHIAITNGKNLNAIKASLQLAKDKGWQSVKATGSLEFQRQTWLMGRQLNIEIQGYTPSEQDKEELRQILEARSNERKNLRNAKAGQPEFGRPENSGATDAAARADSIRYVSTESSADSTDRASDTDQQRIRQQDQTSRSKQQDAITSRVESAIKDTAIVERSIDIDVISDAVDESRKQRSDTTRHDTRKKIDLSAVNARLAKNLGVDLPESIPEPPPLPDEPTRPRARAHATKSSDDDDRIRM